VVPAGYFLSLTFRAAIVDKLYKVINLKRKKMIMTLFHDVKLSGAVVASLQLLLVSTG
jgi:hypothetical protein